jgi:hypothetical protein
MMAVLHPNKARSSRPADMIPSFKNIGSSGNARHVLVLVVLLVAAGVVLTLGRPNLPLSNQALSPEAGGALLAAGAWQAAEGSASRIACESFEHEKLSLELEARDAKGQLVAKNAFEIAPFGKRTLLLGEGAAPPTAGMHGTYLISLKGGAGQQARIICRTIEAREEKAAARQAASRAAAIPAQAPPLKGVSYVLVNSEPLSGAAKPPVNKLTIYNPGKKPFMVLVQRVGAKRNAGAAKPKPMRKIAPHGRLRLKLKSPREGGLAIFEVRPKDDRRIYGAYLGRYSPDQASGSPDLAFAAAQVTCDSGFIEVSSSWQESFIEVASFALSLAPYEARVIQLAKYLGTHVEGLVRVACDSSLNPRSAQAGGGSPGFVAQAANPGVAANAAPQNYCYHKDDAKGVRTWSCAPYTATPGGGWRPSGDGNPPYNTSGSMIPCTDDSICKLKAPCP